MIFGDTDSLGTLPEDLLSRVAFYLSDCPLPILNSTFLIHRPTDGFIFLCHLLPDLQSTDRPTSRWSFFQFHFLLDPVFSIFLSFGSPTGRPTDQQTRIFRRSVGLAANQQTDCSLHFFICWTVGRSINSSVWGLHQLEPVGDRSETKLKFNLEYAQRCTHVPRLT